MSRNPNPFDEHLLLQSLVDGTASETGADFFRAVVKNLSKALGTYGAWVTEYLPEKQRLRALAFWLGEAFIPHYEYGIAGTPCEPSIKNKTYLHIPDNVVELFPGDPDLAKFGAVSYLGFPLIDAEGTILGNIAVVDTKAMPESYRNLSVFRIFAARATAELLRLRADAEIRAREEKLEGLFNGAMDAIVELDRDFKIRLMNPAAERTFGCKAEGCLGRSFARFLESADVAALKQILSTLKTQPKGKRRMWISPGLMARTQDGRKIAAEATISQIDLEEGPAYVLILRDVNERHEARKTIDSLRNEAEYLRDEIESIYHLGEIIGESRPFRETLRLVAEVAPTDSTVVIFGETGTGKELIARAIHSAGPRKDRPLITVNCAAIPETLMESEFFGHEKGAFTGATQRREGRFSLADGGTIFLDEVGELPREIQAKLLRVLQEGEITPVGGGKTRRVDVRVIAATNRDLSQEVKEGRFRTDLYYRLNVFPITVPPLRVRGDDIRLLAEQFVDRYSTRMGRRIDPLGIDCIAQLKTYDWPGNVRELQNIIERSVITARDRRLNFDHALPRPISPAPFEPPAPVNPPKPSVKTIQQLRQIERDNLILALEKSDWRVAGRNGAARLLGVPPSTCQSRMKALKIERPR